MVRACAFCPRDIPYLKREGFLHIYRDKKGFDRAGEVSKMLAQGGLPRRAVTPNEMRAMTFTSSRPAWRTPLSAWVCTVSTGKMFRRFAATA